MLSQVLGEVQADLVEAARFQARQAEGIADAIAYALAHPWIYTDWTGPDGQRAAEAAVLLDLSSRLHLSENRLRTLAATAADAKTLTPWLWQTARDGFAPWTLVEATIAAIGPLRARHIADDPRAGCRGAGRGGGAAAAGR